MRAYQTAYMYVKKYIEQLPLKFNDAPKETRRVLSLVERIVLLSTQESHVPEADRAEIRGRIDGAVSELDGIIFSQYGLTKAEIDLCMQG